MKRSDIKHIEEQILEADYAGTSESYSQVFEHLKFLENKYQSDYLLQYYKGLVCYLNPDVQLFRTEMAIQFLNKSLELNPENVMTRYYLGFCHYDLRDFNKSLLYFKDILSKKGNWDLLSKRHQTWRLVNLAEMVAVCYLNLGKLSKFEFYYMPWKDLYYINIRKDNFYFPESLVIETANYLHDHGDSLTAERIAFFRKVSLDLIGIIRGGNDFANIYSKELEYLKNWDGHRQYQPIKAYS